VKFQRDTYVRTEADILGEFYFQARTCGLEVYLEVKHAPEARLSGIGIRLRYKDVLVE
jgi:hypothetical protein